MRIRSKILEYLNGDDHYPLFLSGDSKVMLQDIPKNSIDCVITSPPYWAKRQYSNGGIGLESTPEKYIENLLNITQEIHGILKPTGSFWLNLGDSYSNKELLGIPWKVAFAMMNEQGWILRNSIIWNKHKGGMNATKDRFGSVHENLFFFVKRKKDYFFDDDAIRYNARKAKITNGAVVSATGVSGVRYKRQIELSTDLSEAEKKNAFEELNKVLQKIERGEISDFRMIIRHQQRATHSDSEKLSGRAKQLKDKGFYFLFYNPNGTMPGDVWDVIPEDTQNREKHYAVFPEDLCKTPILSTCPKDGVVLDPFCGTGTSMKVAFTYKRKSIGIDLADDYIELAKERL